MATHQTSENHKGVTSQQVHGSDELLQQASRNVRSVQSFLDLLEAAEFQQVANLFTEDAVQLIPYAWGAVPREFRGRQAIFELYNALPTRFGPVKFVNRQIWAGIASSDAGSGAPGGVVFAQYSGRVPILAGGEYCNDYFGVFKFNKEGLIYEYSEIWDPIRISQAFGFPLPSGN
jgi:ketosteroid isomerase-like protein